MTEEEIIAKREEIKKNELFQQSSSPYKNFQFEQFSANGVVLEGKNSRIDTINDKKLLVIFNFKNGLIHSEGDQPAIEYPNHWEYWENGLIKQVVDDGGNTKEYWENGVPVRIDRNLSDNEE